MAEHSIMQSRTLPVNFGPMRGANGNAKIKGPCGDTVEFWVLIENDRIQHATFTTDGCHHSILCGSVTAAISCGAPLDVAKLLSQDDVLAFVGGEISDEDAHCALLAVNTLRAAIADYASRISDNGNDETSKIKDNQQTINQKKDLIDENLIILEQMSKIKNKFIILSGKGGVGKSTIAVNIAAALAMQGKKTGILDVNIYGPSIPRMLGLQNKYFTSDSQGIYPIEVNEYGNLKVASIGFLLQNPNAPVVWSNIMKNLIFKPFIRDIQWGDIEYLIIDCPPGTGDEPFSIIKTLGNAGAAILVTTPQEVSADDVSRTIKFCNQLKVPIAGIIENMSGFVCPHCSKNTDIFLSGGGKKLSEKENLPLLGSIAFNSDFSVYGDAGVPFVKKYPGSPVTKIFNDMINDITCK
ncbi:MAG: P-loop NTPase [Candidatus Wallbacteria bacterium]